MKQFKITLPLQFNPASLQSYSQARPDSVTVEGDGTEVESGTLLVYRADVGMVAMFAPREWTRIEVVG